MRKESLEKLVVIALILFTLPLNALGFSKKSREKAPHPFTVNPDAEKQVKRLWPLSLKERSQSQKSLSAESVREEWLDFSKKYPDNPFIPWNEIGTVKNPRSLWQADLEDFSAAEHEAVLRQAQIELLENFLINTAEPLDPLLNTEAESSLQKLIEAKE